MIKNILAVIGVLFCIAWGQKVYERTEFKQEAKEFWEKVDKKDFQELIDEVYND